MARGQPERLEGVGLGEREEVSVAFSLVLPLLGRRRPLPPSLDQQPRREPRGGEAGGKGCQGRGRAPTPSPLPPTQGGEELVPQEGSEVGGRGVPRVFFRSFFSFFFFAGEEPCRGRLDFPAPPGRFREKVVPVGAREELLRRFGGLREPADEDEGLFEEIRVFCF